MKAKTIVVVLLLIVVVAVLLRPKRAGIETTQEQGIWVNYDEIFWVDGECRPEEWLSVVIFELRQDGEVVAQQEIPTSCRVVCDYVGATCEAVTVPTKWDVPGGEYEVWWQGRWRNIHDGRDFVVQPDSLKEYEDDRRFLYFETVAVLYRYYFPLVVKR